MNLKNEIEKQANSWLIRQKEGLTFFEQKEFELWLENKHHKKIYEENRNLIDDCLSLDDDFIKELEDEVLKDIKQKSYFNFKYISASVAILFTIVFSGYEIKRYFIPNFTQSFVSANEKILNIILPDNSIIDLDKKSQIKISYFDTKRVIDLEDGNAMFSVSKDKAKPFLIKTQNTLIEVLGTKFEVINFDNKTLINVLEGVVQVSYVANIFKTQTLAKLEKSQSLILNNEKKVYVQNTIDTNEIATWKNDLIKFNKTSLEDASSMFERYSNNKMIFEDEKLSQLKISGKFSTLHYDSFLKSIEMIYPVKMTKDGNIIKISKK
ncbi:FecR family protein [Arcobacter lacus]|uniref:Siderophore-interacting protein n=1 Tax=Arcobacter lacus TaxID=1912876 RepID=A0ABX5JIE6_9BACT|nr:FecR domain-containing protein [Arcobacter lacus]PUE66296.1 siderophore-interacting protein [Arcobacter lacus]